MPRPNRNRLHPEDMSVLEVVWLAGLLEGEGCFGLRRQKAPNGKFYLQPKIEIDMSDQDVIERVTRMFGTSTLVRPRKTGKVMYRAVISGQRATAWMKRLLPWMGERRSAKIQKILTDTPLPRRDMLRSLRAVDQPVFSDSR